MRAPTASGTVELRRESGPGSGRPYRETCGGSVGADDLVHDAFCLAVFHQAALRTHPKPEGWLVQGTYEKDEFFGFFFYLSLI